MPRSNDVDVYKMAYEEAVAAKATASQLIGLAPQSLRQAIQDWESDPVCPSGNYGVPPDVLAIAANRRRVLVPRAPGEKQIAEALAHYYTASIDAQKKWALLLPNQKQGLTPPDPLAFA